MSNPRPTGATLVRKAFDFLAANTRDVGIVVDREGKFSYVSPWAKGLFGYDPRDLVGKPIADYLHPEDLEHTLKTFQESVAAPPGPVPGMVLRIRRNDGSWAWIEAAAKNCLDDPEVDGILVLARDITHLKQEEAAREAQRNTLDRLSTALQMTADSVVISDLNGTIVYANRATARMWGAQDPSELVGRNSFDLIAPEDVSSALQGMQETLQTGTLGNATYQVVTKDGGRIPVEMTAALIRDGSGNPTGFIGISRDIGERRRVEESLKASEERFRRMAETAPDIVMEGNPITGIEYINERVSSILGYSPEEVIGQIGFLAAKIHPDDMPSFIEGLQSLWGSPRNESSLTELRVQRKDGVYVLLELRFLALWDDRKERLVSLHAIGRDITERKEAERAVIESSGLYRSVVGQSRDPIYIYEPSTLRVVEANAAFLHLLGYSPEECGDLALLDFVDHPVETVRNILAVVLEKGSLTIGERTWKRKDGSRVPVYVHVSRIRREAGDLIFVMAHDLSEQKRLEAERIKWSKLESIGVLAGGIAHDFNNVLTAVLGNVSYARRDATAGSEQEDVLLEAEKACVRAKNLTRQLLTFARGGAPLKQPTDIGRLAEESARMAGSGSGVKLRVWIEPGLKPADADSAQIGQAVQNIVLNAVQASSNGGVVEVRAENALGRSPLEPESGEHPFVKISVQDWGKGIPPEYRDRIFDPYFTTKPGGTGLGLATVHSIVQRHGGYTELRSEVDAGTTFEMYIPVSSGVPEATASTSPELARGQGRILLMDDERDVRTTLGRILKRLGYRVRHSREGAQALEIYRGALVRGRKFDAVIMDLTVPGGMGGAETIVQLLHMDPKARAIVSSGYSGEPILARFGEFGFKAFLSKPYRMEEVGRTLKEVLSSESSVLRTED